MAALAADRSHVWVIRSHGIGEGVVAEVNAADGRWMRSVSAQHGPGYPVALAADGARVWVADDSPQSNGGTVTELNASDGSLVRALSGRRYGIDQPAAIAVAGPHVWVLNSASVSELNASDGSLVRVLSAARYGFNAPSAIAVAGNHVWVTDQPSGDYGGSVTEFNAGDGSLVQVLSAARYGFNEPSAIAVTGAHVWVVNEIGGPGSDGFEGGGSVTELDARTGRLIQTLSGGCYNFDNPAAIVADGSHLWVTNSNRNQTGGSVTEVNAADGGWVRTLSADNWISTLYRGGCIRDALASGGYQFTNPSVIAAVGARVWIPNGNGTVTVVPNR